MFTFLRKLFRWATYLFRRPAYPAADPRIMSEYTPAPVRPMSMYAEDALLAGFRAGKPRP